MIVLIFDTDFGSGNTLLSKLSSTILMIDLNNIVFLYYLFRCSNKLPVYGPNMKVRFSPCISVDAVGMGYMLTRLLCVKTEIKLGQSGYI